MTTKIKTWDKSTEAQKKSIKTLVEKLKEYYELEDDDIFEHDKISYKTVGDGADFMINKVACVCSMIFSCFVSGKIRKDSSDGST